MGNLYLTMKHEGYVARDPLSRETAKIDEQAAEAAPCVKCGGAMIYAPFIKLENGVQVSYRAFAVCGTCDHVVEF